MQETLLQARLSHEESLRYCLSLFYIHTKIRKDHKHPVFSAMGSNDLRYNLDEGFIFFSAQPSVLFTNHPNSPDSACAGISLYHAWVNEVMVGAVNH